MDVLKLSTDNKLKNLTIMHSMLTFVISTLLVFRTNTAYERWWEGRKLWGSLVNNCRNLALKLNALLPLELKDERQFFATTIGNYPFALKNHLRGILHPEDYERNHRFEITQINAAQHNPNFVAKMLFEETIEMSRRGLLTQEQVLFINAEMTGLTDVCGACERIKNTPIPYSYNVFLKKFIFFFVMSLPLTLVFSLGYYCIPVVAFIFYVLTSMEIIAEEIEDPFGKDDNDLPTDAMSKNIRKAVKEIMGVSTP